MSQVGKFWPAMNIVYPSDNMHGRVNTVAQDDGGPGPLGSGRLLGFRKMLLAALSGTAAQSIDCFYITSLFIFCPKLHQLRQSPPSGSPAIVWRRWDGSGDGHTCSETFVMSNKEAVMALLLKDKWEYHLSDTIMDWKIENKAYKTSVLSLGPNCLNLPEWIKTFSQNKAAINTKTK